MKTRLLLSLLAVGLTAFAAYPATGKGVDPESADPFTAPLGRLFEFQEHIRDIHPAFERLYPVAVVDGGRFRVYAPDRARRTYALAVDTPDRLDIPKGVRAAMPLDFWENRMACVVTPEVFEEPAGYAVIFHEFVHCYQWETCELRLKAALRVYGRAMERKDYMWELQHPFPYADPEFARDYGAMLAALTTGDHGRAMSVRAALKARLSGEDREYMTWQEWKEGTARFLENEVKNRFGLPANRGGMEPPFTRVSFYAGGELLIRMLVGPDPGLAGNVEALYRRIAD